MYINNLEISIGGVIGNFAGDTNIGNVANREWDSIPLLNNAEPSIMQG